jgi:thiol-disulfide isomerase/thioredoxin
MTEDNSTGGPSQEGEAISRWTLYSLAAAGAAIAGFLTIALTDRLLPAQPSQVTPPRQAATPASEAPASPGLERIVKLSAPKALSEIGFNDGDGKAHALSEWRGKVVLVNLWATWCAPCQKEMPSLDRLQAKLGGADFAVLPISLDRTGPEKPRQFLAASKLSNLGLYLDANNNLMQALAVPGLPLSVLLDREGREIARLAGPAEWDSTEAEKLIREAISAKNGS